ncbi:hypothetical protein [Nocardia callitridis]|uniref:Secreted protein n=1 Tax=Nocardia callitridis TaxID=648753 RepID=A0ABP9JX33_9NOCA
MVSATRVAAAVVSVLGFSAVIGAGVAQAGPENCVVTKGLTSASASCHDPDAPARREYKVTVECWGLHVIPNAFPFMAIGPYRGGWGGSFGPTGQGQSSCITGLDIGTATNAWVDIYVDG